MDLFKELLSNKCEPWLVRSVSVTGDAITIDLGPQVSAKACIALLKTLPGEWTAVHVERLQVILKLLISRTSQHTKDEHDQHRLSSCEAPTLAMRDALAKDIAENAPNLLVMLDTHGNGGMLSRWSKLEHLLTLDPDRRIFVENWQPRVSAEVDRGAGEPIDEPVVGATESPTKTKDEAFETPTEQVTKPDAWLYLRQCKLIEFTLRCSQPFVSWVNGKTFGEVTFDWCEFNPRVKNPKRVPVQASWRARMANVGLGSKIDLKPKSLKHRFVCVDFQLERYLGALEAAHRAWRAEQPSARAQLYQVGENQVRALGEAAPLVIYLDETDGFHAEWHAETAKGPDFYTFDNTEWQDQARAFAAANPVEGRKLFVAE